MTPGDQQSMQLQQMDPIWHVQVSSQLLEQMKGAGVNCRACTVPFGCAISAVGNDSTRSASRVSLTFFMAFLVPEGNGVRRARGRAAEAGNPAA
jgi:hypothetical protein